MAKAKNLSNANLILTNANIITLDPIQPSARWVLISKDRILSLGHTNDLPNNQDNNTRIIDCHGKTVCPGFIDSHLHFPALAERHVSLDLSTGRNVNSISDIQSRIRTFSRDLPTSEWIRGKGYNEFHLDEGRHPTRWDLDDATSDHPVKITHRSGHAHVLNSLALELVGLSKEIPDPPKGLIDRDHETGEPTGLLFEMAGFLSQLIPPLESRELEKGVSLANQELLSLGITSIQDATVYNDIERWKMFDSWKRDGLFTPRVNMMFGINGFDPLEGDDRSSRLDENQLCPGSFKIILDETSGQLIPPQSELNCMVLEAHQSGRQVAIHAVEEKAVRSAYNAIEHALQVSPRKDHRHRIEHCSLCPPSLAKKLASKEIVVVTQPPFIYYSGERYLRTLPEEQLQYLYPINTLMRNGVKVAGSSDCPVVPPNPIIGIYSAISRRAENGEIVAKEEKIEPVNALRMYTQYAAESSFEEAIKGTLTPGKLADLVILDGDPTRLPPDEIRDLSVEMTILGGEVVWEKNS